jgi:hypothetical protein
MLTGAHKTQFSAIMSADFFKAIPQKMAMNFCHIVRVTHDETWVSFVNFESKSSQKHGCTHITKQTEKV